MTSMAPSHDILALDDMSSLGLWMIKMTRVRELRALNAMKILGLWMI